jgi:hypothetical protein
VTFKKIITLLIVYTVCISCTQSQETKTSSKDGDYPLLITDLEKNNLKGKIKTFWSFYKYNYSDTLSELEVLNKIAYNDHVLIGILNGYAEIDKNGFFTKRAGLNDSINDPIIDTLRRRGNVTKYIPLDDTREKSHYYIDKKFTYPILNPHPIRRNLKFYQPSIPNSSMAKVIWEYIYKFNDAGYPIEEKYYSGDDDNEDGILDESEEKILNETFIFTYDEQNRIVSKHWSFNKEGVRGTTSMDTSFMEEFNVPVSKSAHYEYTYDDKDRINEISFFVDNRLYKKETYTYHDKGWVSQREMFIPGPSFLLGVRWRIIQEFNEYGDIVKARSYDRNETLHNERFYVYEYDEQNNWVKCYIHLENEITDPPTAVAERIFEYYEKN